MDLNLGTPDGDSLENIKNDMTNEMTSLMQELEELKTLYIETSEKIIDLRQEVESKQSDLRLKQSELKRYRNKLELLDTHLEETSKELETITEKMYRHNLDTEPEDKEIDTLDSEQAALLKYFKENGKSLPYMELIDLFGMDTIGQMLNNGTLIKQGRNIMLVNTD